MKLSHQIARERKPAELLTIGFPPVSSVHFILGVTGYFGRALTDMALSSKHPGAARSWRKAPSPICRISLQAPRDGPFLARHSEHPNLPEELGDLCVKRYHVDAPKRMA